MAYRDMVEVAKKHLRTIIILTNRLEAYFKNHNFVDFKLILQFIHNLKHISKLKYHRRQKYILIEKNKAFTNYQILITYYLLLLT